MPAYTFVDEPDQLVSRLGVSTRIGIDTEFVRERTYFAQLCLVQLALGDDLVCVDPLSQDSDAFWHSLVSHEWVLHSGRQDIEVIFQTTAKMPRAVFDTQVAAALLGHQPQLGYANLVNELFDVELAKSHTRANWAQRPLPTALLDYAAEDVEYLLPAYEMLGEKLDKLGRLEWAIDDSRHLLDESLYETQPAAAVKRLKGARSLRGVRFAAASRLADWREAEAIRRNKPRQWILKDKVLLDIAERLPDSLADLQAIDSLPDKVRRRAGEALLAAVRNGRSDGSQYSPPAPPTEQEKALLKRMQASVASVAADLNIAAETLASRKDLAAMIFGGDRAAKMTVGWRHDLIGRDLVQML